MQKTLRKETGADRQTINILLICLCIVIVNIVIYFQVYSFGFVLSDEVMVFAEFHEGFTTKNLIKAFGGPSSHYPFVWSYWAPVCTIFGIIDADLFGPRPGPRHLINLFFHIGSSLLLFILLLKATRQARRSGMVAILFACHPINVEAVAWLSVHDNSLSVFFMLLGFLTYLGYVKEPTGRKYLLLTLFLSLGLMSKSTIVYFPFILLLLDYWPLNRLSLQGSVQHNGKNPVIEKIPLILFVCLWVVISWLFYSHSGFSKLKIAPEVSLSILSSTPEAFVSYMDYLRKIFYPTGLAPSRLLPTHDSSLSQITFSVILLIVISGFAFFCARRGRRYVLMGWLWFIVATAPGVAVDTMKHTLSTDYYAYTGAIGIFIMVVWGAEEIISKLCRKQMIPAIAGMSLVLLLICISFAQARHWQNKITLFKHVINLAPENGNAHILLGDALREAGHNSEALNSYFKGLPLTSGSAVIYNSIGITQKDLGDRQKAIESFRKALELQPGYSTAYHNMGDLLLDQGKVNQAIDCFETALKIEPALFQTHNSLAAALIKDGQTDKAIYHLREALKINPYYETARINLEKITAFRKSNAY